MSEHKFIRSPLNAGAIINTDKSSLEAYKAKKAQFSKINNLEERIGHMETMLEKILNKLEG